MTNAAGKMANAQAVLAALPASAVLKPARQKRSQEKIKW